MAINMKRDIQAPMRQTPFGVWNEGGLVHPILATHAPMRQTPFGVWNAHTPIQRAH